MAGLTRAIKALGVQVFEHSAVEAFTEQPLGAKANGQTITARYIIVATHTPLAGTTPRGPADWLQTKLALYSTYIVAGRVPKGLVPEGLYWSTASPYAYLRVDHHRDHDLVIYGGEDHKTGQETDTTARYERLGRALTSIIPAVEVTHRWSGQVIETPDGLPFLGETTEHQFVATGFAGNGMTFGTLGAMLAYDKVTGSLNPWRDLFAPDRPILRHTLWDYLRENTDYPYYRMRDRFAGAAARSLRNIRRGHGAIVDIRGEKVAAFRDEDGATTLRSPECTHLGCLVAWNEAERTWDCPCHGSRFKPNGDVLAGPAQSPLRMPGPPKATPVPPREAEPIAYRWLAAGLSLAAMVVLPPLAVLVAVTGLWGHPDSPEESGRAAAAK